MADAPMKLITADEAAERLGCSRRTVTRLCMSGQLRFIPGRPVRMPESEVEDYIMRKLKPLRTPEPPQAAAPVTMPPRRRGRPIKKLPWQT